MDLLKEIQTLAAELADEVVALRRDFHRHPELSHQEERTARVVAEYLAGLDLAVQAGVAGHGVVGRLFGVRPGKAVAWRADMDALPVREQVAVPWRSQVDGVMHACGHDFHLAIALGAARLLSGLKDRLAGEYRFIFQPAEEGPPQGEATGARGMVQAGVLDRPPVAAILGLHVAPTLDVGHIRYCLDVVMAGSDHLVLTVEGKSVHGATPHRGIDPILVSAQVLTQIKATLSQEIDARSPVVLTFGKIQGGNRFNILADRVELEGSLRYLQESVREKVHAVLRRQLSGMAKATGARIELTTRSIYPILRNDPRLSERAVEILRQVAGPRRVRPHLPAMGSEDFAYFAQRVPAFYFFLGVRTPGSRGQALHSPELNPDEAALPIGVQAAASLLAGLADSE